MCLCCFLPDNKIGKLEAKHMLRTTFKLSVWAVGLSFTAILLLFLVMVIIEEYPYKGPFLSPCEPIPFETCE